MRALVLFVAVAVMAWAVFRVASLPSPEHPSLVAGMMTPDLDPDGDGRLNRAEFGERAPAGATFSTFDLDGSGDLAPFEIEAILLEVDPVWLTVQEY